MTYRAPLEDMLFVATELADLDAIAALPGNEDATRDTAQAVLEEHARFVENVVAPLNRSGDTAPPSWKARMMRPDPVSCGPSVENGSRSVPLCAKQVPGGTTRSTRSRRRTSSRVSQPLWPNSTSTSSLHGPVGKEQTGGRATDNDDDEDDEEEAEEDERDMTRR